MSCLNGHSYRKKDIWWFVCVCRMYRRTSNMAGLNYPLSVFTALKVQIIFTVDYNMALVCFLTLLYYICHQFISLPVFQDVDKWSFDVFTLQEASSEHALKFLVYELLTRYDLISRFRVWETWKPDTHTKTVILNTLFTWDTDSYTHRETTMLPLN